MKHCLIFLFFVLGYSANAQTDLIWAKNIKGTSSEDGSSADLGSMVVDVWGNAYLTGFFNGTIDFDPGAGVYNLTTSSSYDDIFILKLDASGNLVWAKNIGGFNAEWGTSITIDSLGNVYTTGLFYGTADFDPGAGTFDLSSNGSSDIFISKLDSSGNFVWAKNMGGGSHEEGRSIVVDPAGNIYATGYFSGLADFDPGMGVYNLSPSGSYHCEIFISKFDAFGNFVWAKNMGGPSGDIAYSIAVDAASNVYTTGSFIGTSDFDPGTGTFDPTSNGGGDVFISKLDSSGNFVWAKSMGGSSADVGLASLVDASGNVYTTGYFYGTVDFDPGAGSCYLISNFNDVFISKLDASGNFVWAKSIGGSSSDAGRSMALDVSGNLYTTGNFEGTVDFDPGPGTFNLTSIGNQDIFISKLDASGNFMGAENIGGTSHDVGLSIGIDGTGNVYTKGFFNESCDFDPGAGSFNLVSAGSNDIFIRKTSQHMVGVESIPIDNLIVFPNPSSGIFTIDIKNTSSETNICVCDVLGNCILNKLSVKGEEQIDLRDQTKGIYFLELVSDGERVVKKIVLN